MPLLPQRYKIQWKGIGVNIYRCFTLKKIDVMSFKAYNYLKDISFENFFVE